VTEWLDWLSQYAFEGGIGGLFALSVIDSVGVPTGGGPDVVIALLASLHPQTVYAVELVVAAVLGSAVGCLMLYWIGLRGGEAGARRFAPDAIARARSRLERHGAWVVFLAVLAPPPIPTKLFVFCAGVAAIPLWRFLAATLLGRAVRYGAGALLYGQQALDMLRDGSTTVLLFLIPPGLLLLVYFIYRRRRQDGN
jgi:membrane protein YqaA with SNARE-associated domain